MEIVEDADVIITVMDDGRSEHWSTRARSCILPFAKVAGTKERCSDEEVDKDRLL